MTFNAELVNKFIEAIFPLPDLFVVYLNDYDDFSNCNEIYENIHKIDSNARVYHGISKMVITSPNLGGVVIKIPFNGFYDITYQYGRDYDSYDNEGQLAWEDFYGADDGKNSDDYCLAEFKKYLKLKARNLHCFVAKTLLYKTIDHVNIFLQECVIAEVDDDEVRQPSRKSKDIINEIKKEYGCYMDSEWLANCCDMYGEKKVKKFLAYCTKEDYDILSDMHDANFGYRPNGTPCLLDFSNFND